MGAGVVLLRHFSATGSGESLAQGSSELQLRPSVRDLRMATGGVRARR
jgi:hypothetical protein